MKSLVYGGLDGTITTFAVVSGVAGASLSSSVVIVLGFANLFADGLSMAIGDYLGSKAEAEYKRTERAREKWEIEHFPEGEKKELMELYTQKGITEPDARTIVQTLAKSTEAWVDVMMVEELGLLEDDESPLKNALVTFGSFAFFGFVPLTAFVAAHIFPQLRPQVFPLAAVITGVTLFVLGAAKAHVTGKNMARAGLETLLIGGLAAAVAYGVGSLLVTLA